MAPVDLAACQMFVTEEDYASADAFVALVERAGTALDRQRERGADGRFARPCIAVFPEMIGTFLPLAGRLHRLRTAKTTDGALTRAALEMLPRLAASLVRARTTSPHVGFLLATSPEVHEIYFHAFSELARRHELWVVAGSALLPRNGRGDLARAFSPAGRAIYNTSFTFDPSGVAVGVSRKVNLVPTLEDVIGLTPGRAEDLLAVDTPAGKLGTLICYDGFRVPHTKREPSFAPLARTMDARGCRVLAQPAANSWPWRRRWFFADTGDPTLRSEQWRDEGLVSQLEREPLVHVTYAVTAQLLGQVFDNHFEGRSQILKRSPASGGGGEVTVLAEARRFDPSAESEEVVLATVDGPA